MAFEYCDSGPRRSLPTMLLEQHLFPNYKWLVARFIMSSCWSRAYGRSETSALASILGSVGIAKDNLILLSATHANSSPSIPTSTADTSCTTPALHLLTRLFEFNDLMASTYAHTDALPTPSKYQLAFKLPLRMTCISTRYIDQENACHNCVGYHSMMYQT